MEPNGVQIPAVRTERMDITAPLPVPIDELDTELEGPLGTTDKVIFIETEQRVECADGRNGCLADAYCADLIGLDQRHRYTGILDHSRERGSTHPTGRTAADNDYFSDRAACSRFGGCPHIKCQPQHS